MPLCSATRNFSIASTPLAQAFANPPTRPKVRASPEPLYDAVLIDEAQDLPWPFFRLIYKFASDPRRIVWAYDELQNLSNTEMPSTEKLFGMDDDGNALVKLINSSGQARQDIVLPVCYRNTPWALTLAHALGFGVYRKDGLVQHFDDPTLWHEVGYDIVNGELTLGKEVELKRRPTSYPPYFVDRIDPKDAVQCRKFDDDIEQAEWVAAQVEQNLGKDELEPDDILIIFPDSLTAKRLSKAFADALGRRKIRSHLVGVTTSQDEVFSSHSVAMSHIYRAKGNEAPMVYVVNCQQCGGGYELIKIRNILFTAITRSRAWVRLCGYGKGMTEIKREFDEVVARGFQLKFRIPTQSESQHMRNIPRERSAGERAEIRKAEKGLKQFLEAVEKGELAFDLLPQEMQRGLRKIMERDTGESDGE
ncbi:MAG: DEAD/DEAH box helicase [Planctomycetaceae bacterium]|nr:DEAD/DEAH box helicase [Planctomycetaceae bacterium]